MTRPSLPTPQGVAPPEHLSGAAPDDGPLPKDHTQAILETTKHVAALLKDSGQPFALAGSVAAFAHGLPASFQHDTDFCVRPEDADAAVKALEDGGIAMRRAPEDWLVKGRSGGEEIDLIFELARRPVSTELLERASVKAVDSVWMPVLARADRADRADRVKIFPFLGSYHLAEAIDAAGADFAVHGHAHLGTEHGMTAGASTSATSRWPS
nr:hypothetical protein OG409_34845 [Streptomyces sp. NBC_00974]